MPLLVCPKGVGALLASGGYELLAAVVDFTPPNGVGAFADMGGNAADPVAAVDPNDGVVALAPNGVGAVLDRGGYEGDEPAAPLLPTVPVLEVENGEGDGA